MPWKNGGGETMEIATHPEGAGLDGFDWRLSAARVAQDGPFSLFSGVDRTLAVIDGHGLQLSHGATGVALDRWSDPYRFAADIPTEGHLRDGAITDLNIMTRRGHADHRMRRLVVELPCRLLAEGEPTLVFCAAGELRIDASERLAPGDCAVLASGVVDLAGSGIALVVDVFTVPDTV